MTLAHAPGRHADLIAALTTATNAIKSELDALERAVVELRAQWSGTATDAYDRAHRDWHTTMTALRTALDSATSAARTAGAALDRADRDTAALWNT